MTLVAGADIGGTKIAAGLVDADGTLLRKNVRPTPAADGPRAVVDAVGEAVAALGAPVAALGVGSAGVIDSGTGAVVSATDALPGWAGTDLRGALAERLGVQVAVVNDVHAHALGESGYGAAAGLDDVLFVAVGTGVGASMLIGGAVRHGAHSVAGHIGHVPVPGAAGLPCPCGGTGHAEGAASGPALLAEYRRRAGGTPSDLAEMAARAAQGEQTATGVLIDGATALGQAIGGAANIVDPEIVLVGGGVSECGPTWWEALRSAFTAELLPPLAGLDLSAGRLGSDAALYGAAHLGRSLLR